MLVFLCKLRRNVKFSLTSQLRAGFHQYHKNAPESPLGSAALLDAQTKTKPHLSFWGCASSASQMGIKQHNIFLLSSVKAIIKAYLKGGLNNHVLLLGGEYTVCGWM